MLNRVCTCCKAAASCIEAGSAPETDCRLGPCICQGLADDALHQGALQQLGLKGALHSCRQHILQQLVNGAGLLPLRISAASMQGRGSGCCRTQGWPHSWQNLGPTEIQATKDGQQSMSKGCLRQLLSWRMPCVLRLPQPLWWSLQIPGSLDRPGLHTCSKAAVTFLAGGAGTAHPAVAAAGPACPESGAVCTPQAT